MSEHLDVLKPLLLHPCPTSSGTQALTLTPVAPSSPTSSSSGHTYAKLFQVSMPQTELSPYPTTDSSLGSPLVREATTSRILQPQGSALPTPLTPPSW